MKAFIYNNFIHKGYIHCIYSHASTDQGYHTNKWGFSLFVTGEYITIDDKIVTKKPEKT